VLIKGGEALETAHKIKAIIFDKTGTLTYGKPLVTDVVAVSSVSVDRIVELMGRAESFSEHPLGRAMYKFAEEFGADCTNGCEEFTATPGRGLQCTVDGEMVRCSVLNRNLQLPRAIRLITLLKLKRSMRVVQ
jgi:Cu+-exporting ATPase